MTGLKTTRKDLSKSANKLFAEVLKKKENVTVFFAGDPSVGLFACSYSLSIPEFEEEYREDTRTRIKELYTELDGDSIPQIIFGDESL